MTPPYRMDVHYPSSMNIDDYDHKIEHAAGSAFCLSSGMGQCGRDIQFYYWSEDDRSLAAEAVGKLDDPTIRVVQRIDLDPMAEPACR